MLTKRFALASISTLVVLVIAGSVASALSGGGDQFETHRQASAADCIANNGYGLWVKNPTADSLEEFCNDVAWNAAYQTMDGKEGN